MDATKAKKTAAKSPIFDFETFRRAQAIAHALAHPMRLDILGVIASENPKSVEDITNSDTLKRGDWRPSQSHISQHLRTLRLAGIVKCRRSSKSIKYRLAPGFEKIQSLCDELAEYHAGK